VQVATGLGDGYLRLAVVLTLERIGVVLERCRAEPRCRVVDAPADDPLARLKGLSKKAF
jgi:hypothetical protein